MHHQATASGHVFCVERKRGPQWYAKFRVGGKQIQKRLGPAWIVGGPPPDGYFTRKTAEAELAAILTDARRGGLPGVAVVGATVQGRPEATRPQDPGKGNNRATRRDGGKRVSHRPESPWRFRRDSARVEQIVGAPICAGPQHGQDY